MTGLFNIKEEDVAKTLGLTREELKRLRVDTLYQDEDFGKVGRDITYSKDGVEKIRKILKKTAPAGVTLGDLAPMKMVGGKDAASGPTVILEAMVTKTIPYNRGLMKALLGGRDITIAVRDNTNFTEKMLIPASKLEMINQDTFRFMGQLPRSRGRW